MSCHPLMRNSLWVNDFNLGWTSLISIIFYPEKNSWKFTVPAFWGRFLISKSALWWLENKIANHGHNKLFSIAKKKAKMCKSHSILNLICLHQNCSKSQRIWSNFLTHYAELHWKNSWSISEPDKLVDNLKNAYLSLPLRFAQCPHRRTFAC